MSDVMEICVSSVEKVGNKPFTTPNPDRLGGIVKKLSLHSELDNCSKRSEEPSKSGEDAVVPISSVSAIAKTLVFEKPPTYFLSRGNGAGLVKSKPVDHFPVDSCLQSGTHGFDSKWSRGCALLMKANHPETAAQYFPCFRFGQVEPVLNKLGWKRVTDRMAEVKFRWTECSQQINFGCFKEGEHIVNHVPNNGILTNKLGLIVSLRDFERRHRNQYGRLPVLTMQEFIPQTFVVDDFREREAFFKVYNETDASVWISKPIGLNQGKGIYLVRDLDEFREHLEKRDNEARASPIGLPPRIIQRYITKPLLLNGRKFDIRCFMIVASAMPFLILYHPGYVRLAVSPYSVDDPNLLTHLTNQYMQKKDPMYNQMKNDTVWSINQLNDYVNEHYKQEKRLPYNWVKSVLQWRIQRIIYHTFLAVKNRLATRVGMFEIYGLDFMLDEDLQLWLLEVNSNPAMSTNCDVLKDVLPNLIEQFILITLECFEKARLEKPLLPLTGITKLAYGTRIARHSRPSLEPQNATANTNTSNTRGFGLPEGFYLIYNETAASFRTRWPIAQSSICRNWIVPRYRPPVNSGISDRFITHNNNNNNNNPSSGPKALGLIGTQASCPGNDLLSQNTNSTDESNTNSSATNSSTEGGSDSSRSNQKSSRINNTECNNSNNNDIGSQNIREQAPRHSLPEYRTFEYSLRKYPSSNKQVKLAHRTTSLPPRQRRSVVTAVPVSTLRVSDPIQPLISVPAPQTTRVHLRENSRSSTKLTQENSRETTYSGGILSPELNEIGHVRNSTRSSNTQSMQRPTIQMTTIKLINSEGDVQPGMEPFQTTKLPIKSIVRVLRQQKRSISSKAPWTPACVVCSTPQTVPMGSSCNADLQDHHVQKFPIMRPAVRHPSTEGRGS